MDETIEQARERAIERARYNEEQKLDELEKALNAVIETSDRRRLVALAQRVAHCHLTHQTCKMVFALAYIKAVAEYPYVDARNEASVTAAKAIVAEHPELYYRDSVCRPYN